MMPYSLANSLLLVCATAAAASPQPYLAVDHQCKCFPGDDCWPGQDEWATLNKTVGGRLIATVPLGSPCHDPNYNEAKCTRLRDQWHNSAIHIESSSSVTAPIFAERSCDPFQPRNSSCTLGNYVRYVVDARNHTHVQATLLFAQKHNIRFVIRNTAHDYMGRSTGAGALAVWTQHLKGIDLLDWSDEHYVGKALRLGAGIQGSEALEFCHSKGLVVVTGECPSVSLAGGYTQGGGHSALSTVYGLAADNALSFDVVTPSGCLVTASPSQNQDLYWALSGGGPGNYGVVVAMTVKAHPDAIVSGASFSIEAPSDDPAKVYKAIDALHAALPEIVDSGVMIIYYFNQDRLQVPAMTVYNKTKAETQQILQPFIDSVASMGITVEPKFTEYSSYYDHYNNYWGPLPAGNIQVGHQLFGGRLIPRSALYNLSQPARKLSNMGVTFIGVGLNVSRFGEENANSVLPQWRDSIIMAAITLPWSFERPFEDMDAQQDRITEKIQPVIEDATPGAGAYMNEANFRQPNFEETFYGANYNKLLGIKRRYDPNGLLYARSAVGSSDWTVQKDGRMCRSKGTISSL